MSLIVKIKLCSHYIEGWLYEETRCFPISQHSVATYDGIKKVLAQTLQLTADEFTISYIGKARYTVYILGL